MRFSLTIIFVAICSVGVLRTEAQQIDDPNNFTNSGKCTSKAMDEADKTFHLAYSVADRGQYPFRAEKMLQEILAACPESENKSKFESELEILVDKIADSSLLFAKYYLNLYRSKKGGLKGAQSRLRNIESKYPEYSKSDEVLYLLGETYFLEGDFDKAEISLNKVSDRFPLSPFGYYARVSLDQLKFWRYSVTTPSSK